MIINSISLENFKSYSKMNLDFNSGISIIMGENGAGKSSILEAVSFALFKQHSSRSLQHLIRSEQTKMKVQLDFTVSGRTYRVLRERGKTASKAELRIKEGEAYHSLVSGDKQVSYEIQNLLEMDSDLFLNAVYVRQGEIADLIDKTQSEKKQLIGKLLGIESLEKAWKNMMPLIQTYNGQKQRYLGRMEGMSALKEEIANENTKREALKLKIGEAQSEIKKILMELESIKIDKETMDKRKERYQNIKQAIKFKKESMDKSMASEKKLLDELKLIEDMEKRVGEIEAELPKIDVLKSLQELISQSTNINREKSELESKKSQIEEFQSIVSENEPFFQEYNIIQTKIDEINQEIAPFSGTKELMDQLKKNTEQNQNKLSSLNETIEKQFNEAHQILGKNFTNWEDLDHHLNKVKSAATMKIDSLTAQINDKTREISNLESLNKSMEKPLGELKTVEGQCPVCKSDIDENKKNELLNSYLDEINSNSNSIKDLKSLLNQLTIEKDDLNQKFSQFDSFNLTVLKAKIESLKEQQEDLERIESEMEGLTGKINTLNELEASLKSKNGRLKEIKAYYEKYIKVQGALETAGSIESLETSLKTILEEINQTNVEINKLAASIELSAVEIDLINSELNRLNVLNNEYHQIKGIISKKPSIIENIENYGAEISKIKEELEKAHHELKDIGYDDEIHQNLRDSFNAKNNEFIDAKGQEKSYDGELKGVIENITRIENELEQYDKYKAELSSLDDFIKLLNLFRDLYGKDGIQKELRNMSRPLIEQNTREFFEKFNFEYSDITLDEDYNIDVYGPVGKTTLDMISGGERIAVALALRLGITKALSGGNLELIMLDEPTIHLDTYRRSELIDILKRMSIIPQMIIVTHDVDLEEAAENIIKVEKIEGTSRVSVE